MSDNAMFRQIDKLGDRCVTSGWPTRTKPLARRTLPRGSTERVQELLT